MTITNNYLAGGSEASKQTITRGVADAIKDKPIVDAGALLSKVANATPRSKASWSVMLAYAELMLANLPSLRNTETRLGELGLVIYYKPDGLGVLDCRECGEAIDKYQYEDLPIARTEQAIIYNMFFDAVLIGRALAIPKLAPLLMAVVDVFGIEAITGGLSGDDLLPYNYYYIGHPSGETQQTTNRLGAKWQEVVTYSDIIDYLSQAGILQAIKPSNYTDMNRMKSAVRWLELLQAKAQLKLALDYLVNYLVELDLEDLHEAYSHYLDLAGLDTGSMVTVDLLGIARSSKLIPIVIGGYKPALHKIWETTAKAEGGAE